MPGPEVFTLPVRLLGLQVQLLFGSLDSLTAHCLRSVNNEVLYDLSLFLSCQE